ncbi:MAG TPA: PDR/VanB family oxidoreductase [Steroidobacteraceae bacterium]|nr:PDR/VanB family oxidoreductase [Steroidobacteraceae bacterium]
MARTDTDSPAQRAPQLQLRLQSVQYVARSILGFEFVSPDGTSLPPTEAGAHIGVHLPDGSVRQYSLIHTPPAPHSYEIAVKLDATSRGGSRYMHEQLRVGTVLGIDPPRNNFPLATDGPEHLFFAGGIGVTPIHAMIECLAARGTRPQLWYACRDRAELAYGSQLAAMAIVHLHLDSEHGGRFFDIAAAVSAAPREAHLYCCGPAPMLAAFAAATTDRPAAQVHVEYFTPRASAAMDGGFTVALVRSKREMYIPAGRTILQVLRDAGVAAPSSCEEGICAACETRVLEGVPDHRDSILSEAERAGGTTMMICVSGSKTPRLVLDI